MKKKQLCLTLVKSVKHTLFKTTAIGVRTTHKGGERWGSTQNITKKVGIYSQEQGRGTVERWKGTEKVC